MYLIVDSFCNAQKSPYRWEIGVTDKPLKLTPLDGVWLSWLKHQLGFHEAGLGEQLLGIIHWWNPQLGPRIFFFSKERIGFLWSDFRLHIHPGGSHMSYVFLIVWMQIHVFIFCLPNTCVSQAEWVFLITEENMWCHVCVSITCLFFMWLRWMPLLQRFYSKGIIHLSFCAFGHALNSA